MIERNLDLEKLEKKIEVFAPKGDFELPNKDMVAGPYYASAEERIPELGEVPESVAGDKADGTNAEYPLDRRDFMRLFAMGTAAATASACVKRPVEKAIAYSQQPIDQVPGVAVHYASTCGCCPAACGTTIKTREGRPTKIEGNSEHPISQGGLCALGQADIQGLYHPERLKGPQVRKGQALQSATWDDVYKELGALLSQNKKVGIFTGGSTGNRHRFFEEVLERAGSSKEHLYTWESNSLYASMSKAHELAFGKPDLPRIEFAKAHYIVGIGSDFQGTGVAPVFHSKGFSKSHSYRKGQRGKFVQFESHLTLTGSTADERFVIPAGTEILVALSFLQVLFDNPASKGSSADRAYIKEILQSQQPDLKESLRTLDLSQEALEKIVHEMLQLPSLIVAGSGSNFDKNATLLQLCAVLMNILIGAYEETIFFSKGWSPSPIRAGDLDRFLSDLPSLDVLFVIDSNPLFAVPASWGLKEKLKSVPIVVSMQSFPCDVDKLAHYVLPGHHTLESWGDEQPVAGFWSIRQPTVRPLTDSRQAEESLLWILANSGKNLPYKDYHVYLLKQWQAMHILLGTKIAYETFFKAVVRRGFVGRVESRPSLPLRSIKEQFTKSVFKSLPEKKQNEHTFVLVAPLDHRLGDGRGAHLPVLQEIGDSLTTIAWDTWLALNPNTMQTMGIKRNQVIEVSGPNGRLELAAYPLPGLHPQAAVIPRGNGHEDERSTISYKNGVNPLALVDFASDPLTREPVTSGFAVTLKPTNRWYRLAAMQKHSDLANRKDIIKSLSLTEARQLKRKVTLDDVPDIFPKLETVTYRWGMSIDLDKCNGCGACMAACAVENNVPQVGREQILLGREMHWLRLDRYFLGDINNPHVSFQPVMCQHCNHAPCEPVCPVLATTHDPEGLNAMTYNRCVGTRYCANACTYKVRRFNWWTYRWEEMGQESYNRNIRPTNPDVTVRTKGVMEKCTFCVQRLRDAKHKAKADVREVFDGEIQTACQQTCPMNAIVFGNLNDNNSQVSVERKDPRAYLLLGGEPEHGHYGLKTLPNVSYLAEVSLKERAAEERGGEHGAQQHGGH
ncbi:MAG: 4Fe-4S dicluster domain-containing protein [Oligoflexales bacterium]|nr:4Fe-4S dicluster domain-containing protein [Oligoflexales bacterium]